MHVTTDLVGLTVDGIMTFAGLEWRWIPEESRDGPMHMALEEVAAMTAVEGGPSMIRAFQWEPSTLSMGYGQDPTTVDWKTCDSRGIAVTRRQTGGGGIYHDHYGDISYSIVLPRSSIEGDLLAAYHTLCEPIRSFFDRLGIDADFADSEYPSLYDPACYLRGIHPAHDILVDGRKISGNAQYRQRDAVIQHGSITYESAPNDHLAVFSNPGVDEATFSDRVTGITDHVDVDRETAVELLESILIDWAGGARAKWSPAEIEQAESIAAKKYADDSWLFREPQTTA